MSESDKPTSSWLTVVEVSPAAGQPFLSPAVTRWHKPIFIVFLVTFAVNLALAGLKIDAKQIGRWPGEMFLSVAALTTLVGLGRRLPLQNVLMAGVLIACLSAGIMAVGARSGVPFGPFVYSDALGDKLFGTVPWPMTLLWIVVIINGRGVARLIMRPWRKTSYYGFWIIGLTCLLAVVFDFGLEPFAVYGKEYWLWRTPKSVLHWYTAPWINFLGWFTVPLVILVFIIPWLINKQPVKQPTDFHPLIIWLLLNVWVATGNALHQLWPAIALGLVGNGVMTTLAIRGARWEKEIGNTKAFPACEISAPSSMGWGDKPDR